MTSRLYVKRGGAASAETEVMLAAADRKGSPVFDGTTPKVNLGMRYADGESSQGTYVLTDPLAEIPSDTYRIPPHGLVTLTEDASGDELWLARVRNSQISAGRRAVSVPKNEVEWEVTTVDCNIDLTGNHFVHPWERPAETDIDRIIALQAHILNGDSSTAAHHRKSTVITAATVGDGHLLQDGTTHLDDSLTNLEAKTYPPGTVARDVLEDISEAAGKTYGVVIHHTGGTSHLCLLYVQELDHETYDSAIKISQNIADLAPDDPDTPVFAPIWDRGPGKQIENDHVISGLIDIYGGTADNPLTVFVDQSADDETPHEYWTDAYFDSDSKTEAQATFRANQILASRRPPGHTTHQLSIKMHPEQTRLLCAGMSVSVKSAVVTGAPLSYVLRRVSELRWELAPDGDWFAHLDLDRPIRVRRGSLQAPQAPDTGTPGTPGTGCTTSFTRTWSYNTNVNSDSGDYAWSQSGWLPSDSHFGSAYAWTGLYNSDIGLGSGTSLPISCNAGDNVSLSGRVSARANSLITKSITAFFYGAGTTFPGDVIYSQSQLTPATNNTSNASFSFNWTAPAGATAVGFRIERQTRFDDLVMTVADCSTATPGTDPVPSTSPVTTVGGTDQGVYSDSGEYVPVGSVLEHQYITEEGGPYHDADQIAIDDVGNYFTGTDVEAALQELGAGGGGGAGHTIENNGTPLTARTNLNFNPPLIATDDAVNDQSDIGVDIAEDADISTQAFGDTASAGANTTEVAMAAHKHGMPANPVTTSSVTSALDIAEDADISTQAFGDSAAAGASTTEVAMANHKHGMPSNPVTANIKRAGLTFRVSGFGSVLATGVPKDCDLIVPFDCTISGWSLIANESGSLVVDIWSDDRAAHPPTIADTITASDKPTLSSVIQATDTSPTGWTTALLKDDVIRLNIDSVTTVTGFTLVLFVDKI